MRHTKARLLLFVAAILAAGSGKPAFSQGLPARETHAARVHLDSFFGKPPQKQWVEFSFDLRAEKKNPACAVVGFSIYGGGVQGSMVGRLCREDGNKLVYDEIDGRVPNGRSLSSAEQKWRLRSHLVDLALDYGMYRRLIPRLTPRDQKKIVVNLRNLRSWMRSDDPRVFMPILAFLAGPGAEGVFQMQDGIFIVTRSRFGGADWGVLKQVEFRPAPAPTATSQSATPSSGEKLLALRLP